MCQPLGQAGGNPDVGGSRWVHRVRTPLRSEDTCEITSHEPVRVPIIRCNVGRHFRVEWLPAEEGGAVHEELPASPQHLLGSEFQAVVTLSDREKSTFSHNRAPWWVRVTELEDSLNNT